MLAVLEMMCSMLQTVLTSPNCRDKSPDYDLGDFALKDGLLTAKGMLYCLTLLSTFEVQSVFITYLSNKTVLRAVFKKKNNQQQSVL